MRSFSFNPHRPEGLQFNAGPPRPLNVSIKPKKPDEDGGGFRHGLECRVLTGRQVPLNQWIFVDKIIKRRFEAAETSVSLPLIKRGEVKIDESGRIADGFGVPRDLYPPALQGLCDDVYRELNDGLVRFLKLLRWQQEIDAPHSIFDFRPSLYWRVEAGKFWHVGLERQSGTTTRSPVGITWSDEDQREFAALWAQDVEEPLAHELLREAKAAHDKSPRSALLLAATALETGVKTHLSKLVPDAGWLLSEMPSPPVHKMLRRYVPELHNKRGSGLANWPKLKPLFKDAENLAEYRNDLTHTGTMPTDVLEALPNLINSVSDLLYVLDVLDGHEWAKDALVSIVSVAKRAICWAGRGRGESACSRQSLSNDRRRVPRGMGLRDFKLFDRTTKLH